MIEYKLKDGRNVYFSPSINRFWIDEVSGDISGEYYETELSEIRLEITYLCNGNCNYCIVFGNKIENKKRMQISELWMWLQKQNWFSKIKKIFIIGGEPLLFFNDIEFLLERFEGEVRISTNATLVTREIAKRLKEYNVLLYVSLDGALFEDNLSRVYKNGSYMYYDVVNCLRILREEGVRYGIFMVATKENVYRATETIKQIDKIFRPERIGYSMPHWTDNGFNEVTAEEYRDALLNLYIHRKEIHADIMQLVWRTKPLWQGRIKKYSCSLNTTQITILPDHSVVRCSKIDNDLICKNISDEKMMRACPLERAHIETEPCYTCIALASCGGGCPFDGIKRFGQIIDKRECVVTPPILQAAVKEVLSGIEKRTDLSKGIVCLDVIKEILK